MKPIAEMTDLEIAEEWIAIFRLFHSTGIVASQGIRMRDLKFAMFQRGIV